MTVAEQVRDMAAQLPDPLMRLRMLALARGVEAMQERLEATKERALAAEHQLITHRCTAMLEDAA